MQQIKIAIGVLLIFAGLFSFSAQTTLIAFQQLQTGNISRSAQSARYARYPLEFLSLFSFRAIPDLEVWRYSVILLSHTDHYSEALATASSPKKDSPILDLKTIQRTTAEVEAVVQPLVRQLQDALLLPILLERYWPQISVDTIYSTAELLTTINTTLETLLEQSQHPDQTWIVLLQNSEELRATGGFAGSYALVPIREGQVTDIIVEDIYDADGQFRGYIEPPPGVAEYLSGNNGLRLPDANWDPDHRQSSERILQFFAHRSDHNLAGVVTINLPLVAQLLEITGPLPIHDYNTTITAANLSTQLRAERDSFFPGSKQKKHLLSLALQQLIIAIQKLPASSYKELGTLVLAAPQTKHIMAYAQDSNLQQQFAQLGLDGTVTDYSADEYLYLVESNVGINKVNRGIERSVVLNWQPDTTDIAITFSNHNQPKTPAEIAQIEAKNLSEARHNGYVNYQRILVHPNWELQSIRYDNQPITTYDEQTITTPDGETFKQIGLLITLREQAEKTLQFSFSKPIVQPSAESPTVHLAIQKQPGITPVPYTITTPTTTKHFNLNADTILTLPSLTTPEKMLQYAHESGT